MNYPLLSLAAITILQVTVPGQCGTYENHVSIDTGPDTVFVPYMAVQPVLIFDFPRELSVWRDNEFEQSQWQKDNCAECSKGNWAYDSEKLKYFKELVLDPATSNPKCPAENKKFLQALYDFMLGDTVGWNEYHEPDEVIRPVYKFNDRHLRVCGDFERHNDDGQPVLDFTAKEKTTQFYLFRSNSSRVRPCSMRDETLYRTYCSWFRSNELYVAPLDDTLQPAFCSPFKIALEHRTDTTMNRMLDEKNWCEDQCRWFEGSCNEQITFAQLKEVPCLWFTTDAEGWQEAGFQTRAIYINVNGEYLLELWRYELDMTGIGCI